MNVLVVTGHGQWSLGIGDPTVSGSLTAAGYLIACVLCWRAAAAEKKLGPADKSRRALLFWYVLAGLLLLMGISRQWGLQTWFAQEARHLAKARGWYPYKQKLEGWFVASIALGGTALLSGLLWGARRAGHALWLALTGATFLVTLVIVRASSFHHVDQWLGLKLGAVSMNVALELGGIFCVALAAWLRRPLWSRFGKARAGNHGSQANGSTPVR